MYIASGVDGHVVNGMDVTLEVNIVSRMERVWGWA